MLGAAVIACADTASDNPNPATAIILIICISLKFSDNPDLSHDGDGPAIVFKLGNLPVRLFRSFEIDQGSGRAGPEAQQAEGRIEDYCGA